jgi:tetratricopeptide (TPR) repeat protein
MKITSLLTMAGVMLLASLSSVRAAEHPSYLHALSDLRAARWLVDHRTGDWQVLADERKVVQQIDDAIVMIQRASIDDHKGLNDHVAVDERPDHAGRLNEALAYLEKAREDVNKEEDNAFAEHLKDRSVRLITEAIENTRRAIGAAGVSEHPVVVAPVVPAHPSYLHALANLRAARWLIDHRTGDWRQSGEEREAVGQIDEAITLIKHASIDDGKDLNDHVGLDERPDRHGRLHQALGYLEKARADVEREEDNAFAEGLKVHAAEHIARAIERTQLAESK